MKITKYGLATIIHGRKVGESWLKSEEEARKKVEKSSALDFYHYESLGAKEIDLFCESCDKDLNIGDDYIKIDEETRYCSDCYEATSFVYYSVGGDQVGDENDVETYDNWDKEVEQEEE